MVCRIHYLLILNLLLAGGCAQHPLHPGAGKASSLQLWVDTELAPYVARQLGQHPRFKGESVVLVRLDGSDIQADIDGLTGSIRDQVRDSLLGTPGVRLAWQPQQPPARHHRRLEQARCGRIRDASYFIGFEIAPTVTAEYRVSVRALDVRAGEWVSGFGSHWSGYLTASELRALEVRRSDESLRGLRVLPFDSGQPDLAATYLANNLSCLLRQQDEEDLVIYVEALKSDQSGLRTLLELVGNNLSRYREVRVTDTRKEANFVLRGEAHKIQPGLYQVWVVLYPGHSGQHLTGMDTATYVHLAPAGNRTGSPRLVRITRTRKPAITHMELVRWQNGGGNPELCGGTAAVTVAGDCPLLELTVEQADQVFVFVHGTRDGISRLSSGGCGERGGPAGGAVVKRIYRFPESRFATSDWPTVYAIAVKGNALEQQFTRLLQDLPDACGAAAGRYTDTVSLDPWLQQLDHLIASNSERAVWTARRIP